MTRKSYDTRLKYLAREGLLPETYKKNIHRSLLCKWKQEPAEKYIGYELNSNIEELYEVMKVVSEDQRLQKAVWGIYRIQKTLRDIIGTGTDYIKKLKEHKTDVVRAVQSAAKTISITKACKLVGLSKSTFRTWAMETYFKCNNSLIKLCSNAYPSQLTYQEIKKMHRLLSDSRFIRWPIKSVAYYSIKHNIVKAHPNTWYKYARALNIKRNFYKKKFRVYKEGIKANRPNQKWHADVTELKLRNGETAFIYLVIDNFSRYILSWRISDKLCASTRLDTFREAVINSKIRRDLEKGKHRTQLIVDGGSENNNKLVNTFIKRKDTPLNKVVALKDILKSNSMAESANRLLKYQYFSAQPIHDLNQLFKIMTKSIIDFNCVRPHGALNGLTPFEAQMGVKVNLKYERQLMKQAVHSRISWNRSHNCQGCPFGCSR